MIVAIFFYILGLVVGSVCGFIIFIGIFSKNLEVKS